MSVLLIAKTLKHIYRFLGIFTHFFLLSAFFWLNVRAIIIHATFRYLFFHAHFIYAHYKP